MNPETSNEKTGNVADYFDREISWIEFNARVLEESISEANPLLERLKFSGIVSSNFDEFFMVRMSTVDEGAEELPEYYQKAFSVIDRQMKNFSEVIQPRLEKEGIVRVRTQTLTEKQSIYLEDLFKKELLPLLTPIALREEHEMPFLVNLGLYRMVELIDHKVPMSKHYAVIESPRNLSRMITLPADSGYQYILLEDVIALFSKDLFPGYEIVQQGLFRITRAAELSVNEEKDEDFVKIMTEMLRKRRSNFPVRLEISAPEDMTEFLQKKLEIPDFKVYRTNDWMDLKSISALAFQPGFKELKNPPWIPRPVKEFEDSEDVWTVLKEKDVLVHHPYESFDCFLRFLSAAANDPDVLAIKQTLYRAAQPSEVISRLERAAENGKQVTVLVELKARFDEQKNIEWARRLLNVGATVLYGVAGLKTHAKACLIVRREADGIRRYVHLSTGNYNEKTANLYTDIGFFSSAENLTSDITAFFNVITGYSHPTHFSKIEIAPFGLRRRIERLILREAMRSRKEQPGKIIAKMNSLVDRKIIDALYRASQAGVQIFLNVRGICCLRPGVPGLSENIQVVSIVDKFLEHTRLFYFYNDGQEEYYLSSADWMPRNFDRRLELLFPVEDDKLRKQLKNLLDAYRSANDRAWILKPDGNYERKTAGEGEKKFRIQTFLCDDAIERRQKSLTTTPQDLRPQKPKN